MTATAFRLTNADIDHAFKNRHFGIIFQPVFRLKDARPLRLEAFARWRHPGLGELPPGAFVTFFEQQGRISELTRHLLNETLVAYEGWRADAPSTIGAAFNLAAGDLVDDVFPEHLRTALADSGIDPGSITIDIPLALPNREALAGAVRTAAALKELGVRVAAEARGRAVDTLQKFEPGTFDDVKTGGAAILRFAKTVRGPGLSKISELLDYAKEIGARPVAVGVEDGGALGALRDLGFYAAQGNFLARPGELEGFTLSSINAVREKLELNALNAEEMRALVSDAPVEKPTPKEAPAARRTVKAAPKKPVAPTSDDPLKAALASARPAQPPIDARRLQSALKRAVADQPSPSAPPVAPPPVVAPPKPAAKLNLSGIEAIEPSADDEPETPTAAAPASEHAPEAESEEPQTEPTVPNAEEQAPVAEASKPAEAKPVEAKPADNTPEPIPSLATATASEPARPALDLDMLDDLFPSFQADVQAPIDADKKFISDLVATPPLKSEPAGDETPLSKADEDAAPVAKAPTPEKERAKDAPKPVETAAPDEAELDDDAVNLDDEPQIVAERPTRARRKQKVRYFWPRTMRKIWSEKARQPKRSARND